MQAMPHAQDRLTSTMIRLMLFAYILFLIWLIFFKLQFNFSYINDHNARSLNLVPFGAPMRTNGSINKGEMILNCLFFVPLGLLLASTSGQKRFLPNLIIVFLFSVGAETLQYVFAIGASDITDVIMNTLGGLLGLLLYAISRLVLNKTILDRFIIVTGIILIVLFTLVRALHIIRIR
jgi:glycopeptide antibiotics resistance protein